MTSDLDYQVTSKQPQSNMLKTHVIFSPATNSLQH